MGKPEVPLGKQNLLKVGVRWAWQRKLFGLK